MEMYIAAILLAVGMVLVFSPDYILNKDTDNKIIKIVYDNATIIGLACLVMAYYFWSQQKVTVIEPEISDFSNDLPSYETSIAESHS